MVIFDAKRLNPEWTNGEFPGTMYGLSDYGWINTELFEAWMSEHFLQHAVSARPLLLLLDGHPESLPHSTPEDFTLAAHFYSVSPAAQVASVVTENILPVSPRIIKLQQWCNELSDSNDQDNSPSASCQTPAEVSPSTSRQTPAEVSPSTSLQTPAEVSPSTSLQTPAEVSPSTSLQTAAEVSPFTSLQTAAEVSPSTSRQAPAEVSPSTSRQTPAEVSPSTSLQTPAEVSPSTRRQAPAEESPSLSGAKKSQTSLIKIREEPSRMSKYI